MRELWATGWMHNRVRMIAASLLTKNLRSPGSRGTLVLGHAGGRRPAEQHARLAVDRRLRRRCRAVLSHLQPGAAERALRPERAYLRRWLPELRGLPDAWIHRPSEAPAAVLAAAGVQLGRDYPQPVIGFRESREAALAAYGAIKVRSSPRRAAAADCDRRMNPAAAAGRTSPHARTPRLPCPSPRPAGPVAGRGGGIGLHPAAPVVEQGYPLRKVGSGELRWLGFGIYEASLWTSTGRYTGFGRDETLALSLCTSGLSRATSWSASPRLPGASLASRRGRSATAGSPNCGASGPTSRRRQRDHGGDPGGPTRFYDQRGRFAEVDDPAFGPAFLASGSIRAAW